MSVTLPPPLAFFFGLRSLTLTFVFLLVVDFLIWMFLLFVLLLLLKKETALWNGTTVRFSWLYS